MSWPFEFAERDSSVLTQALRICYGAALSDMCVCVCVMHAANLLRTASVSPTDSRRRVAAGRRWLRGYINGCGHKVWRASLHASLTGKTFVEAAEWAYRSAGFVLIGQCHVSAALDFALCTLLSCLCGLTWSALRWWTV